MIKEEITPEVKTGEGNMLHRVFTALLCALISYLLVIIVHHLFVALLAKALGYVVRLYFSGIDISPKLNQYWSTYRVIVLFAIPSVFYFLFALLIYAMFQYREKENSMLRFFLFWLMMWCSIWPVAQLISAPFSMSTYDNNLNYQGLAVVANWFGVLPIVTGVLGALGAGFVVVLGFLNGGYFLQYIHSLKGKGMRNFWLQAMFYVPVFITLPVSIVFTWPGFSISHLLLSALALFFGLGMSFYNKYRKANRLDKGLDVTYRSNKDLMLVLLLLSLYARFFMSI